MKVSDLFKRLSLQKSHKRNRRTANRLIPVIDGLESRELLSYLTITSVTSPADMDNGLAMHVTVPTGSDITVTFDHSARSDYGNGTAPAFTFIWNQPNHGIVDSSTQWVPCGEGSASITFPISSSIPNGTYDLEVDIGDFYQYLCGQNIPSGIDVAPVANRAPITQDDIYSYAINENDTIEVPAAIGVLANDRDPDSDPLSVATFTQPANGTVALQPDGSFTYQQNTSFVGSDIFTYQASDGNLLSVTTIVTIDVYRVNHAPVATNDTGYFIGRNATLDIPASRGVLLNDRDPDGNPLTAILATQAAHGSVTLNTDGSFSYTPNVNYFGVDSFTYQASDSSLESRVATVEISVHRANQVPIAAADTYIVSQTNTLTMSADKGVLLNDHDPDGDQLTAVLISQPKYGNVTLNPNGSFVYVPGNYSGLVTFKYKASDGKAKSTVATVNITVTTAPVISSIGGATIPDAGISNGRAQEPIGDAYNNYLVINWSELHPNNLSGDIYWTIQGSGFGTKEGTITIDGQVVNPSKVSWSDTLIKLYPDGSLINSDDPTAWVPMLTQIQIITSSGATATQEENIAPALEGRVYGQCTWWVAERRIQMGLKPSSTAYGNYKSISKWTPQSGDQLQWNGNHTAIVESAILSGDIYTITISQYNADSTNAYSEEIVTFNVKTHTFIKSFNLGTPSGWYRG